MYAVFNVVMIYSLAEMYWFIVHLWNYLLMKRTVGQTDAEVVMSVWSLNNYYSLKSNIGNYLYIFSLCIKWRHTDLFHFFHITCFFLLFFVSPTEQQEIKWSQGMSKLEKALYGVWATYKQNWLFKFLSHRE